MGLFDFVTNAGSKLGGKIFDWTHEDEVDITKPKEITPAQLNEARRKSIIENIKESEVPVEDLQVVVDGEKVTLQGRVKDLESTEKLTLVAGNQYGIGSVDCQLVIDAPEPAAPAAPEAPAAPAAKVAPASTFYTVQSGDTLSKIAKKFYGDGTKYPIIFEANKPMLTDPDKIYVGQNLRIPPL